MAFKTPADMQDATEIWVVDAADNTLTSLSRQDDLYSAGYKFEAAISRATMVEGLLLHYLLLAKQIDKVVLDPRTEQRISEDRITFGQVKDALIVADAFRDAALQNDVERYVTERNRIAHRLAAELATFDLNGFHERGRSVGLRLWELVLGRMRHFNSATP